MHKLLGKGSYGKVYKVERESDKQLYALKEADLGSMSQAERADAVNEVRLLVSITHHNVVRRPVACLVALGWVIIHLQLSASGLGEGAWRKGLHAPKRTAAQVTRTINHPCSENPMPHHLANEYLPFPTHPQAGISPCHFVSALPVSPHVRLHKPSPTYPPFSRTNTTHTYTHFRSATTRPSCWATSCAR